MRPRGEVRQALAQALEQLHKVRGAVSAREVASAAQVAFEHARETLKNMACAGEVAIAGQGKTAGHRWHNLYEPAPKDNGDGLAALAAVMRDFVALETD